MAAIENSSKGTSPDVLMLKVNISNPDEATNFVTFTDSTKNLGSIEGNGSGGVSLNTAGGDFAEYLPKANPDEQLNPGDIVGLFPEGVSKKTHGAHRIMVVTSAPAVLGKQPKEKDISHYAPTAFLGQVPVRVEGAVFSGDYIVPSGRSDGIGLAIPPTKIERSHYSVIVGRSLESSSEKGKKMITVLVGLPHNGLWDSIVKEKDARITQLEKRLTALEAKPEKSINAGLLPGAGIFMGSLGFLWVHRRRRDS